MLSAEAGDGIQLQHRLHQVGVRAGNFGNVREKGILVQLSGAENALCSSFVILPAPRACAW